MNNSNNNNKNLIPWDQCNGQYDGWFVWLPACKASKQFILILNHAKCSPTRAEGEIKTLEGQFSAHTATKRLPILIETTKQARCQESYRACMLGQIMFIISNKVGEVHQKPTARLFKTTRHATAAYSVVYSGYEGFARA